VAAQRVLITAGAAGIGRAIAAAFHETGARVLICDIDGEALARLAEELPGACTVACDVADPKAVRDLFHRAGEALGGLDVLVNNAGIGGGANPIADIDTDTWQRTIAVNLSGMFYCLREAAPLMIRQRHGAVINISTASVRTGLPLRLPYVTSKEGVLGLTRNAARELGPNNIRCNAILPGLIKNERGKALVDLRARKRGITYEAAEASYLEYVSMRTWIEPQEVADLAVFLASEKARHITGQFIAVDGNMEWEE
jgi:NAD(P)-dependent dehydrogenase (short-subunit alcohol dehydrogenase family)